MICTTFRPEMLEHADTFLGVIFDNRKISTIKQIEKTHAQQFVESCVHSAPSCLLLLMRFAGTSAPAPRRSDAVLLSNALYNPRDRLMRLHIERATQMMLSDAAKIDEPGQMQRQRDGRTGSQSCEIGEVRQRAKDIVTMLV